MWALLLAACSSPPPPAPTQEPPAPTEEPPAPEDPPPRPDPALKPPVVDTPNRPHTLGKVTFSPEAPLARTELSVNVEVRDPDELPVDLDCTWYVNGEAVPGFTETFLAVGKFKAGDKVKVKVVADDGVHSAEAESAEITIGNEPPRLLTKPSEITRLDGFPVRAEDPEKEPLVFSATGGPDGLTMSDNGILHYRGSETEPGGTYTVTLKATDPHGDFAAIDVAITVSPGSAAPKAAP